MPSLILVKPAAVPVGEFDLSGGPQVTGRLASAGCHIVLNAKPVSKVHATVTAEGGRFFITDEESHNGTLLNGARLPPHVKTQLAPGDRIVMCEFHLVFHARDRARAFTAADLELACAVANRAGVALEKAQVHEAMRAREKEQRDLAVAQDVQKQFLPRTTPAVPGYEFFAHYQTAQRVGGDYYDFITLSDGRLAVVVADVSGKGVPAALLVAKLSSEVRTSLMRQSDLAKAVCALNQQLTDGALGEHYVTLVVMVLDRAKHTLTVVNAGHPGPKLRRAATGALTDLITIEASGQPLGWDRDYPYTAATIHLEQNDTVTAFTDGVTEAKNGAGAAFGDEAVARCLTPVPLAGPDAARPRSVGAHLRNAVYKHLGNRPQSDDIAIVGFGRWEPESDHQTTVMR